MDEKLYNFNDKAFECPEYLEDPLAPRPSDYLFLDNLSAELSATKLKPLNLNEWKPSPCKVRESTGDEALPSQQKEVIEEFEFKFSWSMVPEVSDSGLGTEVPTSLNQVQIEYLKDPLAPRPSDYKYLDVLSAKLSTSKLKPLNLKEVGKRSTRKYIIIKRCDASVQKQKDSSSRYSDQSDNEKLKDAHRSSAENSLASDVFGKSSSTCRQRIVAPEIVNSGSKLKNQNAVEGKELLSCEFCEYKTYVKKKIMRHVMGFHSLPSLKPYVCDKCDYRSTDNYKLSRHIREVHEGCKPHVCHLCTYRHYSQAVLNKHLLLVHEGVRAFPCESCDFKARTRTSLKRHVALVHERVKPYACKMCDYKSSTTTYLRIHMTTVHEGAKPYVCDTCGYRAGYKASLKQHIENVHKFYKYICDVCGYRISKKALFELHTRTIHRGVNACNICLFEPKPKRKFDWKKHIKMHEHKDAASRVKRFVCHICCRRVCGKKNFKDHLRTVHRGIENNIKKEKFVSS